MAFRAPWRGEGRKLSEIIMYALCIKKRWNSKKILDKGGYMPQKKVQIAGLKGLVLNWWLQSHFLLKITKNIEFRETRKSRPAFMGCFSYCQLSGVASII